MNSSVAVSVIMSTDPDRQRFNGLHRESFPGVVPQRFKIPNCLRGAFRSQLWENAGIRMVRAPRWIESYRDLFARREDEPMLAGGPYVPVQATLVSGPVG